MKTNSCNVKPTHFSRKSLNKTIKNSLVSCFLISTVSFNSIAEERSGFLVNAGITLSHDDNVLNAENKIEDNSLILSPEMRYLGLIGKHKFLLSYEGDYALYNDNSQFNFSNHKIAIGARLDHTHRLTTEFKLGYDKKIEEPGSTNASTTLLTQFNEYENKSALAQVYYGQKTSTGQIVLGYQHNNREYVNNLQEFRDYVQNQITATFFYRIAPKSRVLLQASTGQFDYNDQLFSNNLIFNQSSTNNLFLAGIEWEATAKSTGIFKIGYQDRDYDDNKFIDISGLSYMLDMIWKPNTYTQFTFGAKRQTSESAQLNEGGFLSTSYSIGLSHNIMSRTALSAYYVYDSDEIVSGRSRTDKRNTFKLGVKHSLRTWLNIKLDYKYQEKSSNIAIFNFDSNTIELTLESEFE